MIIEVLMSLVTIIPTHMVISLNVSDKSMRTCAHAHTHALTFIDVCMHVCVSVK